MQKAISAKCYTCLKTTLHNWPCSLPLSGDGRTEAEYTTNLLGILCFVFRQTGVRLRSGNNIKTPRHLVQDHIGLKKRWGHRMQNKDFRDMIYFTEAVKAWVPAPTVYVYIYSYVLMSTTCMLKFYACQFVFSYFIKLGRMFAI